MPEKELLTKFVVGCRPKFNFIRLTTIFSSLTCFRFPSVLIPDYKRFIEITKEGTCTLWRKGFSYYLLKDGSSGEGFHVNGWLT
jgi:hypothetical protein